MKENIYFFLLCLLISIAFGVLFFNALDKYFDAECLKGNIQNKELCPEEIFNKEETK